MQEVFIQLALLLGLAFVISVIMKLLKQPLIIGYIITGLLVGPAVFGFVHHSEILELFGTLGVTFLLFIVGLGLNPQMIKDVGPVSAYVGVGQIIFTSVLGFGIGYLLGFDIITAAYLAVAFTFSSTIIILRLIYDKGDQDSLYGRVAIGFLLVQDLVAMLIFVFLSSTTTIGEGGLLYAAGLVIAKLVFLGILAYAIVKFLIPRTDHLLGENKELMFIFSIGLAFVMATVFLLFDFSVELGALIAGVMLSTSPYHREIAARIQPLRDFFLVVFFIVLGANMELAALSQYIVPITVYSLFVLIGNPLIVLFIMTKMGHTRRTAFFAGLTVAQISEFSLIMLGIGIAVGHIKPEILGPATMVGLVTIAASSYMVTYNKQLYKFLKPFLKFLTPGAREREKREQHQNKQFEVLLLGAHRLGGGIIDVLEKKGISYLVIDHDPNLLKELDERGVHVTFGSADDSMLYDELDLSKTRLVISTIPNAELNAFIIDHFKQNHKHIQSIVVANHFKDVKRLYEEGALYVVMPPYLGRRFIVDLFQKNLFNEKKYASERKKHIRDLDYLLSAI